jgi:hypothetical protein
MKSIYFRYLGKIFSVPEGRDYAECDADPSLTVDIQETGEDYVILEDGTCLPGEWKENI